MANWAAGLTDGVITMAEIQHTLDRGMEQVKQIVRGVIQQQ